MYTHMHMNDCEIHIKWRNVCVCVCAQMLKETQKSEDMNVDMLKYTQKDLDTALEMTRKQVEEREAALHAERVAAQDTRYAERVADLHTLYAERGGSGRLAHHVPGQAEHKHKDELAHAELRRVLQEKQQLAKMGVKRAAQSGEEP
ncbi:hypothetical protein AMELA_G00037570 [Ameiurus melas]|uniref:Uncharacterized protein n=1 Tax=Ameiurus melas TaxID=219545 RepID=A0A7J6BBP6_AMEME|nr:hypothetical protein AMELA_G00037570 [Ameiurus melas]